MFLQLSSSQETAEFKQRRAGAFEQSPSGEPLGVTADAWYEVTTRRIDAMRGIEDCVAADLGRLCAVKLAEAKAGAKRVDAVDRDVPNLTAPFAMLVTDPESAVDGQGAAGGRELYGMEDGLPKPMRSILD